MICQKCKEEGKESRVFASGSSSTLMGWYPYYDELGKYHSHNPNKIQCGYRCSNGHTFCVTDYNKCPNCDYGKDDEVIKYFEL